MTKNEKPGTHHRDWYNRQLTRIGDATNESAQLVAPILGAILVAACVWIAGSLRFEAGGVEQSVPALTLIAPTTHDTPYRQFAHALKNALQQQNVVVNDKDTSGSLASLVAIDETHEVSDDDGQRDMDDSDQKSVDSGDDRTNYGMKRFKLAVVQSDVAYHYVRGDNPQLVEAHPNSRARAVARLFSERLELWVKKANGKLAGNPANRAGELKSPPDFSNQPEFTLSEPELLRTPLVCAEKLGSGTMLTTRSVGSILGANWRDFNACNDSENDLVCAQARAFRSESINSISKPVENIDPKEKNRCNKSLEATQLRGFPEDGARLVSDALVGQVYKRSQIQGTQEFTLKWDALLVADQDVPSELIDAVERALQKIGEDCVTSDGDSVSKSICENSNYASIASEGRYSKLPIALHPAILIDQLDIFSRTLAKLTDGRVLKLMLLILVGLTLIATAIPRIGSVVRRTRHVSFAHRIADLILSTRFRWLAMIAVVIGFHLVIGALVWLSELHEHAVASDTEFLKGGLLRSVRWVLYYQVMQATNIPLKSDLAILWVGVLKAGWTLASAALLAALASLAWNGWRTLRMGDNVIVVGWNNNAQALIDEFGRQGVYCYLMLARKEIPAVKFLRGLGQEPIIYDNDSRRDKLADVVKYDSKAVIVLADVKQAEEENQGDVDSWVCRQVVVVDELRKRLRAERKNSSGKGNRPFQILAEVEYPANTDMVKHGGADEVVCQRSFAMTLLAQFATKRGLQEIFNNLFETDDESNEIYFDKLSPEALKTYQTFDILLRNYRAESGYRIPLGIRRDGKPVLNPRGADARLKPGDDIIVLASRSRATG